MIQTQRGMGGQTQDGGSVSVCCPECRTPVFRLARGVSLASSGEGKAMVGPCPKCGEVVRAVVVAVT